MCDCSPTRCRRPPAAISWPSRVARGAMTRRSPGDVGGDRKLPSDHAVHPRAHDHGHRDRRFDQHCGNTETLRRPPALRLEHQFSESPHHELRLHARRSLVPEAATRRRCGHKSSARAGRDRAALEPGVLDRRLDEAQANWPPVTRRTSLSDVTPSIASRCPSCLSVRIPSCTAASKISSVVALTRLRIRSPTGRTS